jgi:Flp pilus assembly protein TadB
MDPVPSLIMPTPVVMEFTDAMAEMARESAASRADRARVEAERAKRDADVVTALAATNKRLDRLIAIEDARDGAEQGRRESRSRFEVIMTSPRMLLIYGAAISAALTYFLGSVGIAPAGVIEALQRAQDVPHDESPTVAPPVRAHIIREDADK